MSVTEFTNIVRQHDYSFEEGKFPH